MGDGGNRRGGWDGWSNIVADLLVAMEDGVRERDGSILVPLVPF